AAFAYFLIVYYVLNSNPLGAWKFLGLAIPALFMYRALVSFRETEGEGKDQVISLLGKDTYEEMLEYNKAFDLQSLALNDFQSKSLGSILIALIVAAVVKQNPPTFEVSDEQ
ncbi:MAG: hypothetical protein HN951_01040, partial [Flavobacteriales bacterium]|nr:hypothetical protein [Flavobacteriales bacterium]